MIAVWGKAVGLGLGVFGGPLGAAFGLFIGHLVDLVAAEFALRRGLARLLSAGRRQLSRGLNAGAALSALAVVSVADRQWRPDQRAVTAFVRSVEGWSPTRRSRALWRWLVIGPPGTERYLVAAVSLGTDAGPERAAERIMSMLAAEDRVRLIDACRETLEAGLRGRVLERLRTLAQCTGISDEWIDERLRAPAAALTDTEREDRELLGVGPDATTEEVKRAYRKLAAQFHPDTMTDLSDEQREASSAAFVRIASAYRRVTEQREAGDPPTPTPG